MHDSFPTFTTYSTIHLYKDRRVARATSSHLRQAREIARTHSWYTRCAHTRMNSTTAEGPWGRRRAGTGRLCGSSTSPHAYARCAVCKCVQSDGGALHPAARVVPALIPLFLPDPTSPPSAHRCAHLLCDASYGPSTHGLDTTGRAVRDRRCGTGGEHRSQPPVDLFPSFRDAQRAVGRSLARSVPRRYLRGASERGKSRPRRMNKILFSPGASQSPPVARFARRAVLPVVSTFRSRTAGRLAETPRDPRSWRSYVDEMRRNGIPELRTRRSMKSESFNPLAIRTRNVSRPICTFIARLYAANVIPVI